MTPAERARAIATLLHHAMYEMSKAYKKWLDDSQELADADLIDAVRVFYSKVAPFIRCSPTARPLKASAQVTADVKGWKAHAALEAAHGVAQAAQTRALREALEELCSVWGERSGNAEEESARLAWFVARNELRAALTGAPPIGPLAP